MSYAMYLRKSRKDDSIENATVEETLARHEQILTDFAAKYDYDIACVYKEVVSGDSIAARPQMQQLLADIEQGLYDGVLVMEVERLARGNTIDQGIVASTFKYSNTLIITPLKTYDPNNIYDEEYFEFGLFMSRREYNTIKRRLNQGRLASVKEGKYIGSTPPYGYDKQKLPGKGYTLTPNQEQAEVVKNIFGWYTAPHERIGVSKIANKLNALGIKPQRSSHWATSSIRDILINPVYAGQVRWNWRAEKKQMVNGKVIVSRPRDNQRLMLIDGLHEPIITYTIFQTAQTIMHKNPPRPVAECSTLTNPLASVLICGVCGKRLIRRPGKTGVVIMCADTACPNKGIRYDILEECLLKSIADWLQRYKLGWKNELEPQLNYTAEISTIEKELKKLSTQLNRLYDLLEQGVYSIELFTSRNKTLEAKKLELEKLKIVTLKKQRTEENLLAQRNLVIPAAEKLIDVYHTLPTATAQNTLLKEVLEKAVYVRLEAGRYVPTDNFTLEIYPKLSDN